MKQNCGKVAETLSDQEYNLCEKTENVIQDKRKSSPTKLPLQPRRRKCKLYPFI